MAGPAVGTSNVGLKAIGSALGEACGVTDSTNISLASLCTGESIGGIQNSYSSGDDYGPADTFNRLGGTNNPILDTSTDNPDASYLNNINTAPYNMSHTFGGQHADLGGGGGPGR
tara:strand:+ start:27 stop:371 length:345 start_codon:yes stop_codon:yes gene_type:complete